MKTLRRCRRFPREGGNADEKAGTSRRSRVVARRFGSVRERGFGPLVGAERVCANQGHLASERLPDVPAANVR
jgi:hypothetical protein